VFASNVSGVGSIGVIATHTDQSEALKQAGLKVTVIRAGTEKALANGAEPLTDAGRAQIQAGVDAAYQVFVQHVAEMRGTTYPAADATMAQGREFFGQAAVSAGLVDGIASFDSLMSGLQTQPLDKQGSFTDNSHNSQKGQNNMVKKAFNPQQIAALAAGAQLASADPVVVEPVVVTVVADTEAAAALVAAALAETEAAAIAASTQTDADANIVAYLKGEVKDKDAALMAAQIEINGLKAKTADMEANFNGLIVIAGASLSNMQIALGGSAVKVEGMSATAILAEHARVAGTFQEKFKAGGVAAVDAAEASKEVVHVPDALAQARLNASRPSTVKSK
jgi:ClpP class serine protease